MTAFLTLVCAVNLRVDNLRADGPRWSVGLLAAERECVERASATAHVPISPVSERGWVSTLPCDYVRR